MARTSKTKIGGDGAEQGERMMRAASSGADAVQRAHSELLNQHRSGADTANRTAQVVGSVVGEGEAREQQAQQFNARMAQDQSQFDRAADQRDDATELEAAKAGFERNGQGAAQGEQGAAGEQGPGNERQAKLEAEMQKGQGQPKLGPLDPESQQRLGEATKQPLEMDGQGRWRPTAERAANMAREQKREDFKADTERMRALAYEQQVAASAQKALMAGDTKTYEEHAQILANVPNDRQKQYDRLMKGEVSGSDWSDLAKEAADNPEPGLAEDIKAKNFTPRVAAFVRAQVGIGAMKAIVGSMGDTTKLKIDWTNPVMVQFQQMVQTDAAFMRANPALGELGFIKSTDDKMRFLNVMAAAKVASGMGRAPRGKASGGMTPATTPDQAAPGGQQPQQPMGPAHSTPAPMHQQGADAVRKAREGGATPQEALQQGQRVAPTGRHGVPPERPSYHEMRRAGL